MELKRKRPGDWNWESQKYRSRKTETSKDRDRWRGNKWEEKKTHPQRRYGEIRRNRENRETERGDQAKDKDGDTKITYQEMGGTTRDKRNNEEGTSER